ncbi:MAG: hypothetical protein IT175_15670 [Acidobacteria bacterium]|nr:hypothetical protein [Acidobacteriota bacterium]
MSTTGNASGDNRNWLQRLADKIPGISGYQAKETRRDVDKLFRVTLADRLRRLKDTTSAVVRDLTDGGRLFEVAPVERVSKKIDTLENRVRFATYGYAGFFDAVQIKEDQLDMLYRFDVGLVERIENIEGQAAALRAATATATELKAATSALEQSLDDLHHTFDTRHDSLNGFGSAEAPGRPLFS